MTIAELKTENATLLDQTAAGSVTGALDKALRNTTIDTLIDRGNHTGTQLAATISDLATVIAAAVAGDSGVQDNTTALNNLLSAIGLAANAVDFGGGFTFISDNSKLIDALGELETAISAATQTAATVPTIAQNSVLASNVQAELERIITLIGAATSGLRLPSAATIAARDLLTGLVVDNMVIVQDDGDGKWADYRVNSTTDGTGTNSTWIRVGDADSLLGIANLGNLLIALDIAAGATDLGTGFSIITDNSKLKAALILLETAIASAGAQNATQVPTLAQNSVLASTVQAELERIVSLIGAAGQGFRLGSVATIAARDLLTGLVVDNLVHVKDDGDGKWAEYRVDAITDGLGSTSTWIKLTDEDSLTNSITATAIRAAYLSVSGVEEFTTAFKTQLETLIGMSLLEFTTGTSTSVRGMDAVTLNAILAAYFTAQQFDPVLIASIANGDITALEVDAIITDFTTESGWDGTTNKKTITAPKILKGHKYWSNQYSYEIITGSGIAVRDARTGTAIAIIGFPISIAAGTITATSIVVTWAEPAHDNPLVNYKLYRDGILEATITNLAAFSFDVTGLTANTSYAFTMTSEDDQGNPSELSPVVSISTVAGFDFGTAATADIWYKPDSLSVAGALAVWPDALGVTARDLSAVGTPQVALAALNGYSSVIFDGVDDTMVSAVIPNIQAAASAIVMRVLSVPFNDSAVPFVSKQVGHKLLRTPGGSAKNVAFHAQNGSATGYADGTIIGSVGAFVNGAGSSERYEPVQDQWFVLTTIYPTETLVDFLLEIANDSADPGRFLHCEICEVMIMKEQTLGITITESEIQVVEGYLHWKYGLQGNLPAGHPYKNAAP